MHTNSEQEVLQNDPLARSKSQKNFDVGYAFKQQLLSAWRPKPTLKCAITVYLFIGLIFFALGICILVFTDKVTEKVIRYDNIADCEAQGSICTIAFTLSENMTAPVYVYYEIDNFYQNHRRYILTIPTDQLRGDDLEADDLSDCDPVLYNKDIPATVAVDGTPLDPEAVAIPCGNAARAVFNDSYLLIRQDDNTTFDITDKGIAWQTDIDNKFKNIDLSRQWLDMENERFITWMKIAPFSNFRKAWGIINQDLIAGSYIVVISSNWDSKTFGGKKSFVITNTNVFGSKNYFLAYAYIAIGALSILLGIVFIFRKLKRPKGILNKVFKETKFTANPV